MLAIILILTFISKPIKLPTRSSKLVYGIATRLGIKWGSSWAAAPSKITTKGKRMIRFEWSSWSDSKEPVELLPLLVLDEDEPRFRLP